MSYPKVLDEFVTLKKLHEGFSIARFGDGEFKMVDGKGYVREPVNQQLTRELRSVLEEPASGCLIGIPTMNPKGPKYPNWGRHLRRFEQMIPPGTYYSAFISRPDSAPWIRTLEFAQAYQALWAGKRVSIVCEKGGSALRAIRPAAGHTVHIRCPSKQTYAVLDALEAAVLHSKPEIVFLSCGVAATCFANRLTRRGLQAIDFGSAGSFLAKLLQP